VYAVIERSTSVIIDSAEITILAILLAVLSMFDVIVLTFAARLSRSSSMSFVNLLRNLSVSSMMSFCEKCPPCSYTMSSNSFSVSSV